MIAHNTDFRLNRLVEQAREGNRSALEELAGEVEPRLRRYFQRSVADCELIDDLVQETLLHVVRAIGKLEQIQSFRAWLYRIASCQLKNHFRKAPPCQVVSLSVLAESSLHNLQATAGDRPDYPLQQEETLKLVRQAMGRLKGRTREIVHLRLDHEWSYDRIGETVGCSAGAARTRVSRARQVIRDYVNSVWERAGSAGVG